MSEDPLPETINEHWLSARPRQRRICQILLAIAFLCTFVSMFLPFISIDKPFKKPQAYSITQTISLMWGSGLYVLAIIICAFSIIFPFLKIASMTTVLYRNTLSPFGVHALHLASRLGKWSMIDVFIVSLLLGIGERQILFKVFMHFGLYLFTFSILLSISIGIYLSALTHTQKTPAEDKPTLDNDYGHGHSWLSIILLSISSLAFIGLCIFPFLAIDDWRLRDRDFTLLTFIRAIWNQGAHLLAIYFTAALLILPAFEMLSLWILMSKHNITRGRLAPIFSLMRHWSTLDVFLIALLIFVVEGDKFIKFNINIGFWLLAISLIAYISRYIVRYRIRKVNTPSSNGLHAINNEEPKADEQLPIDQNMNF